MASLWGAITGADRKNASAEQLKKQAAKDAADKAAADKAAREAAERKAAQDKVDEIRFAKGGKIDGVAKKGKTRGRFI